MRAIKIIKNFFFSLKVKRRIEALTNIANHVAAISASTVLIEQNLYLNIERLTEHVATKKGHLLEA
jgi:hypothetical protein